MQSLTALFVGRFQPFHNGHLSVIKKIVKNNDVSKIIIAIGSSQYKNTPDNPYSAAIRKKMIKSVLKQNFPNKKFLITLIPDIHNDKLWVSHVISITKTIDLVYTGNIIVKKLFRAEKIKVFNIKKTINISGTRLRKMISLNNNKWHQYIPKEIHKFINK